MERNLTWTECLYKSAWKDSVYLSACCFHDACYSTDPCLSSVFVDGTRHASRTAFQRMAIALFFKLIAVRCLGTV